MNLQQHDPTLDVESVKHLWDVWQYRHGFFWGALARWGVAVVIVSSIPHVQARFLHAGALVQLFPATALALTIFSSIHLLGEHQRLIAATRTYLTHCGKLAPDSPPPSGRIAKEFTFATGIGVIVLYFVSLSALSAANAWYLYTEVPKHAAEAHPNEK